MLDFCAKGADGVTVRRVTLFVVVFKMAGGLPSRARVATGVRPHQCTSAMRVTLLEDPEDSVRAERGCARLQR